LTENRISVLIVVPTFLALFNTDGVPCLRLIVLGGEMYSEHLVNRWVSPERQVYNTYGPTEATVSASCALLKAHTPVTIGQTFA
jgi:non-ribosomal peptide synthetase component F